MKITGDRDFARYKMRTTNSLDSHRARAKKAGKTLDYAVNDLRRLANETDYCPYCNSQITTENLSYDHFDPLSRGGSHGISNIIVCCWECNIIKGSLTQAEFTQFLEMINRWAPEARKSILARIKAGNRIARN